MKNIFKFFVPVAVAAIALVSCQVEIENIQAPGEVTIRVHATADELNAGDPETKTYIATYQGTANTILWGTGEYMKLALTAGEATSFVNSTDASADVFEGEPEAMFEFSASPASASEYVYQGLYPASAAVESNNTNPANYKVNLPATQNATASSYDPAAYIMVAKPETFDAVQTDWTASFRRATALNKITLKNVPSGVSIKRVEITTPTGKFLAGGRHINLTTTATDDVLGDIYSGGGRTEKVEVKFATPQAGGANFDVWFCSWGVEVAAGETLTIVAYTTDKKSYTKTIEVPANKSIKFQEGYLNTLGANMSGITPENATELEEGDYLILANNNGTYYALKAEAEGTRMNYEDYSGSTSSFAGAADLVWTVAKTANGYSIANDGKYLGFSGTKNTATLDAAGESWTATNYEMDITWDTDHYSVAVHSDNTRILAKNTNSQYGFAFYTGSGYNNLIFVPATVDNRTAVTLTFANDQVDLTPAEAVQYLGENLTISPDVAAVSGHLTWSYEDNDGIIDEFDNGALTLTGDEGTATVTVSFGGDANYLPASASYTITVAAASVAEPEWVETAIGDLTSSDIFVMVANGAYAISSAGGSSTNPPAVSVTVSGTKLTGDIADAIKWNISGDATNGFTFYPNGETTKLFCNTNASSSSNTNLRVGAGGNYNRYLFVLDSDHIKTNDEYTARYIGINGTSDFRGYVSASANSCTFKFYKYVDVQDNRQEAGMSWSSDSATATYSNGNSLSFTAPTLTAGNATGITYESTDETIATINASGVVTITALSDNNVKEGSTTIKAIFAGDTNYKPQTVSYTLTVVDSRSAATTPTFSPAAGEVAADQVVTFNPTNEGLTFHYTVDGTDPTVESPTAASVTIDAAKTVKVLATKTGYKPSAIATAAYTVAGSSSTIAQVLAGGAGTYTINNILVYTVVGNQVIVGDSTGKMVLYKSGHGLAVGDNISIPTATVADYNGILQIQDGTFNKNSTGNAVDHGTATNLNDATVATSTLSAFSASGYHTATFVTLNGSQSGRNINGANATLYLSSTNTTYDGQAVTVTGYIYYYNTSYSNYNFQLVSIAPDESTPTISVSPSSLSWAAAETDSKTLTVTLNGAAAAGDYSYSVTSGTVGDWNISDNGSGTITVSPKAANTSTTDAKSITLRISHADDSTVYQDVTCTQAKDSSSGGGLTVGTVLFTESFGSAAVTPFSSYTGTGSTSYNSASTLSYTCKSSNTKIMNDTQGACGPANLLIGGKNGGAGEWAKISGIKTYGATKVTVTWASNGTVADISIEESSTTAVRSASGDSNTGTFTLSGSEETITLVITAATKSNTRVDTFEITVAE